MKLVGLVHGRTRPTSLQRTDGIRSLTLVGPLETARIVMPVVSVPASTSPTSRTRSRRSTAQPPADAPGREPAPLRGPRAGRSPRGRRRVADGATQRLTTRGNPMVEPHASQSLHSRETCTSSRRFAKPTTARSTHCLRAWSVRRRNRNRDGRTGIPTGSRDECLIHSHCRSLNLRFARQSFR